MKSQYGNWESQGEAVDAALWDVAGRHHAFPSQYGITCLCGERTGTNRRFTEHVIDQTLAAIARVADRTIRHEEVR